MWSMWKSRLAAIVSTARRRCCSKQSPQHACPRHHVPVGHHRAQCHVEHHRKVDLDAIVHRVLSSGNRAPVAARIGTLPSQPDRIPVPGESFAGAIHPEELRYARLVLEQDFHAAAQKIRIRCFADAHADVHGNLELMRRLEHQVGECIGRIIPCGIGAPDLCVARVHDEVAAQVEQCLFIRQDPPFPVPIVVRVEELIDPSERAAHIVHLRGKLVPEHPLAHFAEGGGYIRDQSAR